MTRLSSINITDFRSIRGSITIPLDAPVVLIHGHNGAGKTSLLSAIELGLTGEVPTFARVDSAYVEHLVHKEADASRISLNASGVVQSKSYAELRITRNGMSGAPLLQGAPARFYSERCYLAQATLGRLLELYEDKDTRKSDSTLTKFVKDLLGLDHLDALIDGLHDAGDVRRFRSTVPAYWETREGIPALSKDLDRLRSELDSVVETEARTSGKVSATLLSLSIEASALSNMQALQDQLSRSSEEGELQRLASVRRNISAVEQQWRVLENGLATEVRDTAERRASATAAALEAWQTGAGRVFDQAIETLSGLFPDRQQLAGSGPASLYQFATQSVDADLARLTALLQRAVEDETTLAALNADIGRAQARSTLLESQIAECAQDAGQLAKVLGDLLPHVHSEDCPVCGRDFSETDDTGLYAHLSTRINHLTDSAGRLQALSKERAQTVAALADAQRQRDTLSGRRLDPRARDEAKTREARLKELRQSLLGLETAVKDGQRFATEAATANRELTALQSRDLQGASVRETLTGLANALGMDAPAETEGPDSTIARFQTSIETREAGLERRLAARRSAMAQARELGVLRERRSSLEADVRDLEDRIAVLMTKKDAADKLINEARELARHARDARTSIVRRVFNDSLNSIWRDLFVRLAPEEPFVPAFALPESAAGAVEAVLETHYRSGGKGGNPRAMLSAGNLNTAALTLFLALHLSVAPTLPWLVIDDPVQSMDEVHIAQFAALLRTLSKSHGRQIIIAVHERQLFEYLSLELSPAFQSDRLITIELSRGPDGATLMNYQPIVWQPDSAIAA